MKIREFRQAFVYKLHLYSLQTVTSLFETHLRPPLVIFIKTTDVHYYNPTYRFLHNRIQELTYCNQTTRSKDIRKISIFAENKLQYGYIQTWRQAHQVGRYRCHLPIFVRLCVFLPPGGVSTQDYLLRQHSDLGFTLAMSVGDYPGSIVFNPGWPYGIVPELPLADGILCIGTRILCNLLRKKILL